MCQIEKLLPSLLCDVQSTTFALYVATFNHVGSHLQSEVVLLGQVYHLHPPFVRIRYIKEPNIGREQSLQKSYVMFPCDLHSK